MNNSKSNKINETDLIDIILTIWKGKWQIIFITFLSTLIGIIYIIYKPKGFDVTLPIHISDNNDFTDLITINEILDDNEINGYSFDSETIFQMFVSEFNNYEEMTNVVSNNDFIIEAIKDLSEYDREWALSKYARSFSIIESEKPGLPYRLSFRWNSAVEGMNLLEEGLNDIFEKIRSNITKDLEKLAAIIDRKNNRIVEELQTNLYIIESNSMQDISMRLQHLEEQSQIAKELNLEINMFNTKDFSEIIRLDTNRYDSLLNSNKFDPFYYIRGYKAIDKEIDIIKKRTLRQHLLTIDKYNDILEQITITEKSLSSNHLRNTVELIENANISKWFSYDLKSAKIYSLKKTRLYLMLSILLGGILGVAYVLFLNFFQKGKY